MTGSAIASTSEASTAPVYRVLHVTTVDMSLVFLLLPQLVGFKDAGFEVITASAPGPFVPRLLEHGIQHVPLKHATRARSPLRDVAALWEFWQVCRRLRPDVVHTHNPKPGLWGRIAARLAGVPVVVNTVHGLYALPTDPWPKRVVVYGLERLASIFSDAELLQNVEDLPVLRRIGVPERKLTVLSNGIDLERFDPDASPADARLRAHASWGVTPDTVVIGGVGRLVAEKGWRDLFAAVRVLRAEGLPVTLVAVGPDDPDKPDSLSRGELDAARADEVVIAGWQDDVERLYAGMDVFCLPSRREGFPRAAMEAAAMGLPIVATDVRGCRQVVADGITGTLVPVGDVTALTDALRALVTDADLRAKYGRAAREHARSEFDVRSQIATTVALYERLTQATHHRIAARATP